MSSWDVWLRRLSSEGALAVGADWQQLGPAEGSVIVEGGDPAIAAQRARPIWPGAGPLNAEAQPSWSISFTSSSEWCTPSHASISSGDGCPSQVQDFEMHDVQSSLGGAAGPRCCRAPALVRVFPRRR